MGYGSANYLPVRYYKASDTKRFTLRDLPHMS